MLNTNKEIYRTLEKIDSDDERFGELKKLATFLRSREILEKMFHYRALHERDFRKYLTLQSHETILEAFAGIADEIQDGKEYWGLMRDVWTRGEDFQPKATWHKLLRAFPSYSYYMMSDAERDKLASFPSILHVYRGVSSDKYIDGFSWTLDLNLAEWFAKRFGTRTGRLAAAVRLTHYDPHHIFKPTLITGTILTSSVIAFLNDRDEQEIIVLPNDIQEKEIILL